MGLNGRKLKQRIGNDPRNLSWADDAARFGINYLAKFGWDSSKGLGASGEGRKSHLDVSKKLDMLGIGAAHQLDANGIAWKQNKDFENLLKRLNGNAVEGLKKADSGGMDSVREEAIDAQDEAKKRKRDDSKEASMRKKKKKIEQEDEDGEKEDPRANEPIGLPSDRETVTERRRTPTLPRHRAHRARAIAAKNLSSKSAAQLSEILGIAPTPLSTTATSSGLTSGSDTPQDVEPSSDTLEIERITTSTKSVHDYFKDKLKTKKLSTFVNPSVSSLDRIERDLAHDPPRGGLGSSSRTAFGSSTLSSTFLAAASQPLPSDATSHTEAVVAAKLDEVSAAAPITENRIKRKKRSKVASDDDARSLRKEKEGKIAVVGECHSESPVDREDKNAREDIPADLTTKKKKGGKRKKKNILEIREIVDYTI